MDAAAEGGEIRVAALHRYPVKGLGPDAMDRAEVEEGGALPFDRAWAIENGPSGFDPEAPRFLPKTKFVCLMRQARLAALKTHFDESGPELELKAPQGDTCRGRLDREEGRAGLAAFVARFLGADMAGPARIVAAPGHTFSDCGEAYLSIINLASLAALSREMGVRLDPVRFRGNLVIEGAPAFAEFSWTGRRIRLSSGLVLEGVERITRCAATSVEPASGRREHDVPRALMAAYGHLHCGIYARAMLTGRVASGDRLSVE